MSEAIAFSGNPLDRSSMERRDPAWLAKQLADGSSRFLPVWRLSPLVKSGSARALAWARSEVRESVSDSVEPILLGVEGGVAHFALDVSGLEEPENALGVRGVAKFEEVRGLAAQLSAEEAAISAHARSLVDWHARHRFCSTCGESTSMEAGGNMRVCDACSAEHFPRTDPVAIAVPMRDERCLLGRGNGWPPRMFSALAGFIEPGETIEEAIRREVAEETGVKLGAVRYVKSQPWPFVSSLMIGCLAKAESEEIVVDREELQEARWFSRPAVQAALAGRSEELIVPPPVAIAHHLIRSWAES